MDIHALLSLSTFWYAVADAEHPRHEEALSGVKASRARLLNETESRKQEVTQCIFTTEKVKTLPDDAIASSLEVETAGTLKVDYGLTVQTALQNVQQELATKEIEQWARSEMENTELREKLGIIEKTVKDEDNQEPKKRGLELNVISGKTFKMSREGSKVLSITSVAGHQVVKNLNELSELPIRGPLSPLLRRVRFLHLLYQVLHLLYLFGVLLVLSCVG